MDYCGPRGIPHSRFLAWDRGDRDLALWWHLHRAAACPTCGTRAQEWDEDAGGSTVAYRAEIRACRGCEVTASAQAAVTAAHGKGAHVVLVRTT